MPAGPLPGLKPGLQCTIGQTQRPQCDSLVGQRGSDDIRAEAHHQERKEPTVVPDPYRVGFQREDRISAMLWDPQLPRSLRIPVSWPIIYRIPTGVISYAAVGKTGLGL